MPRTAKVFKNGRSQAVRLPAEFRFTTAEVYIRRDATTGDVILSQQPPPRTWAEVFATLDQLSPAEADTVNFTRDKSLPEPVDLFDDWQE